jgi:hypothetical protein
MLFVKPKLKLIVAQSKVETVLTRTTSYNLVHITYLLDMLLDRILFEMEWQGDRIAYVSNSPLRDGIPHKKNCPKGREGCIFYGVVLVKRLL